MTIRDIPLTTIDGDTVTLAEYIDRSVLVVNVASRCGLTPQYEQLEQLQKTYGDRGIHGARLPLQPIPPGTGERDRDQGVLLHDVGSHIPNVRNGEGEREVAASFHAELTKVEDGRGKAGKVQWNFEKFLVSPDDRITRFRPRNQTG